MWKNSINVFSSLLSVFNVFYMNYFLSRVFRVIKLPKIIFLWLDLDNLKVFISPLLPRSNQLFFFIHLSFIYIYIYKTTWKYIKVCTNNLTNLFNFSIPPASCWTETFFSNDDVFVSGFVGISCTGINLHWAISEPFSSVIALRC